MKQVKQLLLLFLVIPFANFAQDFKNDTKIPFDPDVKTGKLQNGLTYYIKKNKKPENKVDLRLVINAGSILETDKQLGLAHFMEHMCFNGTKNFPKNKLVDYLQSIGVKFGQHLNAYTSFDETVYFLPIPSDDAEKLDKGFQILEDWAFNAVLTPEEIDKERGVVLEEYRIGLGADKRMMERWLPKMMYNSHYAKRLPIGKKEILENFKHEELINFYKDWYRPNLMSVIVVGDIDVAQMEQKIKDHFSSYQNPKNEKPRTEFNAPNHKETFISIEKDKEATSSSIQLMYKDLEDSKTTVTVADYNKNIAKNLFSTMLNNRLEEIGNEPNPPYTYAYSYHGGSWAKNKDAFQSYAMTQDDKQLEALKVIVTENERAKKHGFTQGELDRAKSDLLAQYERYYNDREKNNSSSFVGKYQRHFLKNSPAPSIEWEFNAVKNILPGIQLSEVNAFIQNYIKDENRFILLTGPDKEGVPEISEADVLKILKVDTDQITPYNDTEVAASLIRKDIQAGKVDKKESNSKIGSTTLTLSNGMKVTYKKTDFKNDEILMEGISFGGTNLYSNEDFKKTQFANQALTEAGFSGLKLNDINRFMSGKIANATPYIGSSSEGFYGNTTPKDVEYLFQMIHAYFTDLNLDKEAFESYKQKQSAFYKNLASNPNVYFQIELYTFLYKDNPRFFGLLPDDKSWEYTDYELAYNKYKERFANAGDFEFFFVGNIDDTVIEDLSSKYLASLPSSKTKEKAIDLGHRMAKVDTKKIIKKGTEPKSNVNIMFYGDATYSPKEALAFDALGEVLGIKLIEELRENESGVYGASANGSMSKVPYGSFSFNISFPCGPENAESLTNSALRELQKLIDNGPTAEDLSKYKEGELLDYKKNIKENRFWLSNFSKSFTYGNSPDEILNYEERLKNLTAKDLQDVAKKYLTKEKLIAMLMPE